MAGKHGFPVDPKVWHFHPVGLAENFTHLDNKITVDFLERVLDKKGSWFNGKGNTIDFEERFKENYPDIYQISKGKFVRLLNDALIRYGIDKDYYMAHFISQCFHESAHFETTIEFASGEYYNPGADNHPNAKANGNTQVGDGPKYKGKGLIQLTWKKNYKKYTDFKGGEINFVDLPDLLASDMYYAIDVSCWFWRNGGGIREKFNAKGDINVLIDNDKNNVALVTKAINGSDNGLSDRMRIFNRIREEWGLK